MAELSTINFQRDEQKELISNPHWCWEVFGAIDLMKANNCYVQRSTAGAWGIIKHSDANWNDETNDCFLQLNSVYSWLKNRFPSHPVTLAISAYLDMGWYWLQIKK